MISVMKNNPKVSINSSTLATTCWVSPGVRPVLREYHFERFLGAISPFIVFAHHCFFAHQAAGVREKLPFVLLDIYLKTVQNFCLVMMKYSAGICYRRTVIFLKIVIWMGLNWNIFVLRCVNPIFLIYLVCNKPLSKENIPFI